MIEVAIDRVLEALKGKLHLIKVSKHNLWPDSAVCVA